MSDDALHEALNRNVDLREELALTQKAYDAEVEHYRVRMNEQRAENARLRAVVEAARKTVGGSIQAIDAARAEEMGRDVILRNVSVALTKAHAQLDVSGITGERSDDAGRDGEEDPGHVDADPDLGTVRGGRDLASGVAHGRSVGQPVDEDDPANWAFDWPSRNLPGGDESPAGGATDE